MIIKLSSLYFINEKKTEKHHIKLVIEALKIKHPEKNKHDILWLFWRLYLNNNFPRFVSNTQIHRWADAQKINKDSDWVCSMSSMWVS